MPNPKTLPSCPKPQAINGWVRKCDLDDYLDRHLPVPTQAISNEEYLPTAQTPRQRRLEELLVETTAVQSRRLGMDRRHFLRTSCGMAVAFAAMNSVFGHFFQVHAAEMFEPDAAASGQYFIFDVQTHHVVTESENPRRNQDFLRAVVGMRRMAGRMDPRLKGREPRLSDAYLENYIKEVFLDSETDMVALSALPSASAESSVLSPEAIAKTKGWVNDLTRSPRVISHGYFSPDLGKQNLESMQAQAEKLRIDAWKGYTGVGRAKGVQGWRVDDEKLSYPALEYSRKIKITSICLHKGLPFPGDPEYWNPKDIVQAAKDFPDLNFLVYHSGFRSLEDALPAAEDGFRKTAYIPWVSDLCQWRKRNPEMNNVYMELGSTFALMVSSSPLLCAHVLGMMIDAFGADHVLWGTDSIWWGSPQWQIEAFRRFQIPEDMQKRFGYKPLTPEVKRQIFGLNAARVYGVDPAAKRNPVPGDYVEQLRKTYKESGLAAPSNTQYGWVLAG
ncbi:MAG TPA: amidohydrolase family protein [Terriglobales bacterium]|jgi:hypothetical protein|nr:amidohydrolase family protein [Terriglobales bacterium]